MNAAIIGLIIEVNIAMIIGIFNLIKLSCGEVNNG